MTETVSDDIAARLFGLAKGSYYYLPDEVSDVMREAASALSAMKAENAALKSDLTRYIDIATKEATEAESLRAERGSDHETRHAIEQLKASLAAAEAARDAAIVSAATHKHERDALAKALEEPKPEWLDDVQMSDELHEELRKQGAFSIERHGKIALSTYAFGKIVWDAFRRSTLQGDAK